MRQSRSPRAEVTRPQLIQSMIDAMRVPDLRSKIIFTLAMLLVYRFIAHVAVPGVDGQALSQAFEQQALLGFLDLFSGGALSDFSVAALGATALRQGDVITATYTDPTDASGNAYVNTDSSTLDLRTGSLLSDKSVYVIGSDAILTIVDAD